jgi:hypothetical protein
VTATTTLSDEIGALMADVVDVTGAAFSALTWALGRREDPRHASPPRVVWVPVAATPKPAQKHAFPSGARSVLTRVLQLEVRVWGETLAQADAVLAGVLAAAHRRWPGRWSYLGERWEADPAQMDLGELVTATVAVEFAVLDRPKTVATLIAATPDTTAAVAEDGVLHLGE